MSDANNKYLEQGFPEEFRFIWDRPLSSRELGGLIATRGFWYQYLYVLRLMRVLLDGTYDSYACEWIEDFLVWKRGATGEISKLSLVQVKTSTNMCFLKRTSQVKTVLRKFLGAVERISSGTSAQISCQLIYNDYHDCDCEKDICRWNEYQELNERLWSISDTTNRVIEFQRFLPVNLSAQAIIAELEFLKAQYRDLYSFLTSPNNLQVFLQSLFGLIFPFHSARAGFSLAEPARRNEFPLWKLHHHRADVVRELRQALDSAIQRAWAANNRVGIQKRLVRAKSTAQNKLHSASSAKRDTKYSISGHNTNQAEHALMLANILDGATEGFLLQPGRFQVDKLSEEWNFSIEEDFRNRLVPLYRYVTGPTSHFDRVNLILSFVRTLSALSQKGVSLMDFRANDPAFRDRYFVEKQETGQPRIVLGDFAALSFITEDGGLLDQHWCRGSVISKAVRYLYYGTPTKASSQRTRRYKAIWNDNVITEFADWLELVMNYIEPTELETRLTNLFADEINRWPLVITEVDKEFISDIAYHGIDAIASALDSSKFEYLVEDRGPWQQQVYYALSETEQIGLLFRSFDNVCLYRYTPYFTQRWERTRQRDVAMALPLRGKNEKSVSLVRLSEPWVIGEFLKNVFNVDIDEYCSWFQAAWQELSEKRSAGPPNFPKSLILEEQLLRERRIILDVLSHQFEFKLQPTQHSSRAKTGFRLIEKVSLRDALPCLGYTPENFASLKIKASDTYGRKFEGVVEDIVTNNEGTTDIIVPLPEGIIGDKGTLRLLDPGADTVVGSEETLLRELKFSLSDPERSASKTAWQIVKHMCGDERPKPRASRKLWQASRDASSKGDDDATQAEKLRHWLLDDGDQLENSWRAITGAAGTGKTRQTATLVVEHLEANAARIFPPTRVLVVAATHYALNNFMDAFKRQAEDKYTVFRFVPDKRRDELLERKIVDSDLFNWSVDNRSRVKSELPQPTSQRTPATLQQISAGIDQEIAATTALLQRSDSTRCPSSFIPSHERWRKDCGLVSDFSDLDELKTRLAYLEVRSEQVRSSLITTPFSSEKDFDRGPLESALNIYTLFASDVLVTTVDAFDRLPDLSFDLLVIEEASQLRILKLLKVITKVVRGRRGQTVPKILLSGDAQQLPPFVDSFNKVKRDLFGYLDPRLLNAVSNLNWQRLLQLRASETPFDSICKHHEDRVARLTTQWRMRPNLARIVNELFYSDEKWTFPLKSNGVDGGRICWKKSTGSTEYLGTSSFNESEVGAVKSLIKLLQLETDDVLVVTPYTAQVTKLRLGLPRIKVTTIDGCQGIQAPIVIVSFVSFDFSLKHDFVIEPRRMNVALSRASEVLCLVGNFEQLIQKLAEAEPTAFPHLRGLVKTFRSSGPGVFVIE